MASWRRALAMSVAAARTTTTPRSAGVDRPGSLDPQSGRHGLDARRGVALDVGPGVGDRECGAGETATGSRIAKDEGRPPVAPSQPKTGRSGIPIANGSHDQAVPLKARS